MQQLSEHAPAVVQESQSGLQQAALSLKASQAPFQHQHTTGNRNMQAWSVRTSMCHVLNWKLHSSACLHDQSLSPCLKCGGAFDKGQPCRVGGGLSAGMFHARTPVEDAQEAVAQDSPLGAAHRPAKVSAGRQVNLSHHLQYCRYACLLVWPYGAHVWPPWS